MYKLTKVAKMVAAYLESHSGPDTHSQWHSILFSLFFDLYILNYYIFYLIVAEMFLELAKYFGAKLQRCTEKKSMSHHF